jgi:hypothetical protein
MTAFNHVTLMLAQGVIMNTELNRTTAMELSHQNTAAMLRQYSDGTMSRKELQKATGLWFGDILLGLSELNLPLPRFDSRKILTPEQKELFAQLIG